MRQNKVEVNFLQFAQRSQDSSERNTKINNKQKFASFTDKLNILGGLIFWGTFLSFRYISNIFIATPLFLKYLLYKFPLNTLSKHDILSPLRIWQYRTYLCCTQVTLNLTFLSCNVSFRVCLFTGLASQLWFREG